ncbi:3-oxoadipate CoA-transferase subunit B [Klebsiella variicola]|nr:3-oxoadipate CoA-transferase subunit B [Klebsiella variicola]
MTASASWWRSAATRLTGVGCVSRIYTDLAVIDITDRGPVVREIFNGLSFEELQRITPVALTFEQLAESA